MKTLFTVFLLFVGITCSIAQSAIEGYEYWFNDDFVNKTYTSVISTDQLLITQNIPTTGLPVGLNILYFRAVDNAGIFSSTLSHFFYKTSIPESTLNPEIVAYEYWMDDDYANAVKVNTPLQQQVNINELIPMNSLGTGIHKFNIRVKNNAGLWSSVVCHFFYKTSVQESNSNSEIVAYEYWLDDDYANAIKVNTPVRQQVNISELVSMNSLRNGLYVFNIRFKNNAGLWSSVVSNFIYKNPEKIVSQNMITEYRYWFDSDFDSAVQLSLAPNQQIDLNENLNLTQLPKGKHEINFQFKDTLGMWSVVVVDSIEKISLPVADFTFSTVQNCDSTTISFDNKSIDGDVYLWNFGDGKTSTEINPTHVYYVPDAYQVSLTLSDTLNDKVNAIVLPVVINSLNTVSSISETACNSYKAPDGQLYTTSGIKTAIITNAAGCDSTVIINLTINTIDASVIQNGIILSANATAQIYKWLDCDNAYSIINGETSQSFTPTKNGNYAVELTLNNCVDTSACFEVILVGIIENTFSNLITVYPNPTNGRVIISLGEFLNEFTVSISDISGKLISLSTYKETELFEINLNVKPGVYSLKINSIHETAILKLIKN